MIVTNEPRLCTIRIDCEPNDFAMNDLNSIESVRIKRKTDGSDDITIIGEMKIGNKTELSFAVRDTTAQSHKKYRYYAIPVIKGREAVGTYEDVESVFSAYFIGNLNKQFVCALNAKCERSVHYNMSYVQTFYRQYPHAIQNGNMKYNTGSFTGLFLDRDESGEFTKENAQAFKEQVIEFLTDGDFKIIKTGEGNMWYVQINGEIRENYSDFIGASTISFDWTEIGAATDDGIVVVV